MPYQTENSAFYLVDQQFYSYCMLCNGADVDALYCDFMKGFHTVPHQSLLMALRFYNTSENSFTVTECFGQMD